MVIINRKKYNELLADNQSLHASVDMLTKRLEALEKKRPIEEKRDILGQALSEWINGEDPKRPAQ